MIFYFAQRHKDAKTQRKTQRFFVIRVQILISYSNLVMPNFFMMQQELIEIIKILTATINKIKSK